MDIGLGILTFGTLISVAVFAWWEARTNAEALRRKRKARGEAVAS